MVSKTSKKWDKIGKVKRHDILMSLGLTYGNAKSLCERNYEDLPFRLKYAIAYKLSPKTKKSKKFKFNLHEYHKHIIKKSKNKGMLP